MVESPGRITLWGIEIFVAAAEEKSISSTAKRLSASPSAISQQLTNLEAGIGAKLLDRGMRPHQLTVAGIIFLKRAKKIISEASYAKAELAVQDLSKFTRLRLGVIEDFDANITPKLLMELSKEFTGCQIQLETAYSLKLKKLLEKRQLDMIIAADLGQSQDWMEVYPIVNEPFVVAAPKGLIMQNSNELTQLLKLPFIKYSSTQAMGQSIDAHLLRQEVDIPHKFELDSYHASLALVANKTAWTITTPLGFAHAQRFHPDVELLPLPLKGLTRTISVLSRADGFEKMPKHIASLFRLLLKRTIIKDLVLEFPWLEHDFRILET